MTDVLNLHPHTFIPHSRTKKSVYSCRVLHNTTATLSQCYDSSVAAGGSGHLILMIIATCSTFNLTLVSWCIFDLAIIIFYCYLILYTYFIIRLSTHPHHSFVGIFFILVPTCQYDQTLLECRNFDVS